MKTRMNRIILGAAVGFALGAAAQTRAAEATVGSDIVSSYVWRGITFNDGFVWQPSMDVTHESGLGFNAWGNFDLDEYKVGGEVIVPDGEFSEVDLTVSYGIPLDVENLEMGVGLIEYLFPGVSGSTREVYGEVGYDLSDLVDGLGTGAFVSYDFDEVDDWYGNLSLAYGYEVDEKLSLELSGLIGFAGSKFSSGIDGGAHEWQVGLSAAYALSDATELGAFVAYTDAVDSDVLVDQDTDFYGGISAYYSF